MSLLRKLDQIITKYNRRFLVILMTGIALLITTQVIFRYIFHVPMHFLEETLTLLSVWLFLLGNINASRDELHINARILEIFSQNPKYINTLRILSALLSVVVTIWLTYWSYDFLLYSIKKGKISQILGYPMIILECAMFVCFIPICIYTIRELYKYTLQLRDNLPVEAVDNKK